jgi:hypothetical protein
MVPDGVGVVPKFGIVNVAHKEVILEANPLQWIQKKLDAVVKIGLLGSKGWGTCTESHGSGAGKKKRAVILTGFTDSVSNMDLPAAWRASVTAAEKESQKFLEAFQRWTFALCLVEAKLFCQSLGLPRILHLKTFMCGVRRAAVAEFGSKEK